MTQQKLLNGKTRTEIVMEEVRTRGLENGLCWYARKKEIHEAEYLGEHLRDKFLEFYHGSIEETEEEKTVSALEKTINHIHDIKKEKEKIESKRPDIAAILKSDNVMEGIYRYGEERGYAKREELNNIFLEAYTREESGERKVTKAVEITVYKIYLKHLKDRSKQDNLPGLGRSL